MNNGERLVDAWLSVRIGLDSRVSKEARTRGASVDYVSDLYDKILAWGRDNPEFVEKDLPLILDLAISTSPLSEDVKLTAKRMIDSAVGAKDIVHAGKRIFQAIPPEQMEQILGALKETGGRYREGSFNKHLRQGFLRGLAGREEKNLGKGSVAETFLAEGSKGALNQAINNINPYRLGGSLYNLSTSPKLKDKVKTVLDDRDIYGNLIPTTVSSLQTSARNAAADRLGEMAGGGTKKGAMDALTRSSPAILKILAKKSNYGSLARLGGKLVLGGSVVPWIVLGQAAGGAHEVYSTPDYFGKLEKDTRDWRQFQRSTDYKELPSTLKRALGASKAFGVLSPPKAIYSGSSKFWNKIYGVKDQATPYGQSLRGISDVINPDMAGGDWGKAQNLKIKLLKKRLIEEKGGRG